MKNCIRSSFRSCNFISFVSVSTHVSIMRAMTFRNAQPATRANRCECEGICRSANAIASREISLSAFVIMISACHRRMQWRRQSLMCVCGVFVAAKWIQLNGLKIIIIKWLKRLHKSHRRSTPWNIYRFSFSVARSQIRHKLNRSVFSVFFVLLVFWLFNEICMRDFVNHMSTYFAIDKINIWVKFIMLIWVPIWCYDTHSTRLEWTHRTATPRSIYTLRRHK